MSVDLDAIERAANGCSWDFCTGVKRREDNWCARCAEVKLAPPKHWGNMEVCDECDAAIRREVGAPSYATSEAVSIYDDAMSELEPGNIAEVIREGHVMHITATRETGINTGRRRYMVECLTCTRDG